MELTALRIALLIGIALVFGLLVVEIRAWITGTRAVTRKQKVVRISSAVLIVAILAMVLVGDRLLKAAYGPLASMAYWMFAFGLALMLVVLVLADIREVGKRFGEERKRMYRDLAKSNDEDSNVG